MPRRTTMTGLAGAGAHAATVATSGAQGLVGLRAEWGDLETWSHQVESSKENELGLGLQVSGPNGLAFIAFLAKVDPRNPSRSPAELSVQVAAGQRANPNVVRRPSLGLLADARSAKPANIDLGASLVVDNLGPGSTIENGVARIRAADFARVAKAVTLSGNVFGFDVTFRPDQIKAMLALAERAHIPIPKDPEPGGSSAR